MAYSRNLSDTTKYINLTNIPDDSISSIRWSNPPNSLFIAAGSWDKTLRIWQLNQSFGSSLSSNFKASFITNAPILSVNFSQDNSKIFAGSCDNTVKMFDLASGSQSGIVIGQHQKPVMAVHHLPQHNAVLSGGWDGMVAIWDTRQPNPAWSKMIDSKVFAMDFKSNIFCAADNKLKAHYWNINNLNETNTVSLDSSMKTQTRAVSLFPEQGEGFGATFTSIGGRCVVFYFSQSYRQVIKSIRSRNFSFKCHRTAINGKGTHAFPINAVDFYGNLGTFVTGGADGNFIVWDKDNKTKVKSFPILDSPIVDLKFNTDHRLLACATSYDWHKGFDQNLIKTSSRKIQIIQLQDEDFKPKPKESTFRR